MKQNKWIFRVSGIYFLVLLSVGTVHLIYLLNPDVPVTTLVFLMMFLKVLPVALVPVALLLWLLRKMPILQVFLWNLVPFSLLFAFLLHFHALESYIDRSMQKIFIKEIYALVLLCAVTLLLSGRMYRFTRKAFFFCFAMLILVHIYQYNRRDSWTVYRHPRQAYPAVAESPVRTFLLLSSPFPFSRLLELAEGGALSAFSELYEQSARGRFKPQVPQREAPVWFSLYTGVYPDQHRVFYEKRRVDPLFPSLDLFPFYWPPWPGTKWRPADRSGWHRPPIWDVMQSFSISSALYYPPHVHTPPSSVSRAVTVSGYLPEDHPPESSCVEFIHNNPASFLAVAVDAGKDGEGLEAAVAACLDVRSERDQVLVVDPVSGRWFLHWGSGVAEGATTAEARVVDLLPTHLFVHGLPIPRYAAGRILLENFTPAFRTSRTITVIPGRR